MYASRTYKHLDLSVIVIYYSCKSANNHLRKTIHKYYMMIILKGMLFVTLSNITSNSNSVNTYTNLM